MHIDHHNQSNEGGYSNEDRKHEITDMKHIATKSYGMNQHKPLIEKIQKRNLDKNLFPSKTAHEDEKNNHGVQKSAGPSKQGKYRSKSNMRAKERRTRMTASNSRIGMRSIKSPAIRPKISKFKQNRPPGIAISLSVGDIN